MKRLMFLLIVGLSLVSFAANTILTRSSAVAVSGSIAGGFIDPSTISPQYFTLTNEFITGANGTTFTNWPDSSGNNNHFTNLDVIEYAVVTNTSFNSKRGVFFFDQNPLNSSKLYNAGLNLSAPFTLFLVMEVDVNSVDRRGFSAFDGSALLSFSRSGPAFSAYAASSKIADFVPTAGVVHVGILRVTAVESRWFVDGVDKTVDPTSRNINTIFLLGANNSEGSLHTVFEFRCWTNALTTNALNGIGRWSSNKFGHLWIDIP